MKDRVPVHGCLARRATDGRQLGAPRPVARAAGYLHHRRGRSLRDGAPRFRFLALLIPTLGEDPRHEAPGRRRRRPRARADRKLAGDAPDADHPVRPRQPRHGAHGANVPDRRDRRRTGSCGSPATATFDLTVVGPEAPLADGLADALRRRRPPDLRTHGGRGAHRGLEGVRQAADGDACGVPTASFRTFDDADAARAYLAAHGAPDRREGLGTRRGQGRPGLRRPEEARAAAAIHELMVGGRSATPGETVVIEEFMEGEELSVFFVTDGDRAVPLAPARDHKRRRERRRRVRTRAAWAPSPRCPAADAALIDRVRRRDRRARAGRPRERGAPPTAASCTRGSCSPTRDRRSWSSTAGSATRRPRPSSL